MFKSLTTVVFVAGALAFGTGAFAQDDDYGQRGRSRDELNTPLEIDGLALGRDAPFLSSDDLGLRGRAGSFEIEGPPIGSALFPPASRP